MTCSDKWTLRREERGGREAESLAKVAKMVAVTNGKAEKNGEMFQRKNQNLVRTD